MQGKLMFNILCAQKPSRAVLHKHLTGSDGKANLNNFIVGTFKANAVDLKKCEHNIHGCLLSPEHSTPLSPSPI